MKIAIVALGWLGLPLAKKLSLNHQVVGSKRTVQAGPLGVEVFPLTLPLNPLSLQDNPNTRSHLEGLFAQTQSLVIILPASRQPQILAEYAQSVSDLVKLTIDYGIKQVIFTSSTSVYGDLPGRYNEDSPCQPTSGPGKVLVEVEQMLIEKLGPKVTILRLAGLAGYGRHPGRFFSSPHARADNINGDVGVNFVHGEDVIRAIEHLIHLYTQQGHPTQTNATIYNLCAPIHPSKTPFYAHSAAQLGLAAPVFKQNVRIETTHPMPQFNRIIEGTRIISEIGFAYQQPNPYYFNYTHPF